MSQGLPKNHPARKTLAGCQQLCITDKEQRCRSVSWAIGDCNIYPGDCPHTVASSKYRTFTRQAFAADTMPPALLFSPQQANTAMYRYSHPRLPPTHVQLRCGD